MRVVYIISIIIWAQCVSVNARSTSPQIWFKSTEHDYDDTFKVQLGNLLFDRVQLQFLKMQFNEVRTDTIRFINISKKDILITIGETAPPVSVILSSDKIQSGQQGYAVISCNASFLNESGTSDERIILKTNDLSEPQKIIQVISSMDDQSRQRYLKRQYPHRSGSLMMTKNRIHFPTILNTQALSDSIQIYNNSKKAIQIDIEKPADHLSASIGSNIILPEQTIALVITFDATKVKSFGFVANHRLQLHTTDSVESLKIIYVTANVKEDFSELTPADQQNAPVIEFDNKVFDFGKMTSGSAVHHSFTFRNTGKSDLIIRRVSPSCGCTVTTTGKTVLKPGETSSIDVVFNTQGRKGIQLKSLTVIANDPQNPESILHVKGVLE